MTPRTASRRACFGLGFTALGGRATRSQPAGPFRPMRLIVPNSPGTPPDLIGRTLADGLSRRRGHSMVVENRTGADGTMGADAFARAHPGEALCVCPGSLVTIAPLLMDRLPYDPVHDLVPLYAGATDFFALSVAPSLPVQNVADLIAYVRARPGALNWYGAIGSVLNFRALLHDAGGLDMTFVSYRGTPPALLALAGGDIHAALTPFAATLPLGREGRVRMLAVTYRARSDLAPEVPTAVEAGAPALAAETSIGLYGWRGMPEPARAEFAAQARAVMAERGIVERVRAAGLEPRDAGSPQAFAAELAEQRARYTALAREFGARPAG